MRTLLAKASYQYLLRHPWQLLLALVGIMLGVAVVIAIDLAIDSSLRAFEQAGKAVSGNASHTIIAATGGLDEGLYVRLRVAKGVQNLSPRVKGTVKLTKHPAQHFKLVGIDPLAERALQAGWQLQRNKPIAGNILLRLMHEDFTALLSRQTAQKLHLAINDLLAVATPDGVTQLKIIGFLEADNALAKQALANLLITDIATAQLVLHKLGQLSAIDVLLPREEDAVKLRAMLPKGLSLVASAAENRSIQQMTEAFSINLKAMGLLSLLIGMFLIYNTMTFLAVQRRQLFGILRALGVTQQQLFKLLISEALLLAIVGTCSGILLGFLLGGGLLELVSATINAIYFRIDASALVLTGTQLMKALLLGIGTTLLAVLLPAWEATRGVPRAALQRIVFEKQSHRISKISTWLGGCCVLTGGLLTLLSASSIVLGLASVFFLLFGFALMTPGLTLLLMPPLEPLLGLLFGIQGRIPPRMVAAEISRTGIAIAALMIAVAATIGMDLMINSFRETVAQWLQTSLQADFYISRDRSADNPDEITKDLALKRLLAEIPGVRMLSSVFHTRVVADGHATRVAVFELNNQSKQGFILEQQIDPSVWQKFTSRQATVFVTEAYAYHHATHLGDQLLLQTRSGLQPFTVIAVYKDYSGDRGHLAMGRNNYLRYWQQPGYSGIGVYADPASDMLQLQNRLADILPASYSLQSNQNIYQASMQIFEQTFRITLTMRWLAAAVAFVGVFSALMALQFERTRQLGVFRAMGMTPGQLSLMISAETGLMGCMAGLLAIPAGYLVSVLLIYVVYQRSFGWVLTFHMNPAVFLQGLGIAIAAALLAGIIPALKMAGIVPAEALRNE